MSALLLGVEWAIAMKRHILLVSFCAVLSASALAGDEQCPVKRAKAPALTRDTPTPLCVDAETGCTNTEVGVLNWLTDTHRSPSLHFIDFVEVFLR